jgi:hypothetical protein
MQEDFRQVLDDGQVIKGKIGDLTQHQVISLANQLMRGKNEAHAHLLMQYQHKRFHQNNSPFPPMAA